MIYARNSNFSAFSNQSKFSCDWEFFALKFEFSRVITIFSVNFSSNWYSRVKTQILVQKTSILLHRNSILTCSKMHWNLSFLHIICSICYHMTNLLGRLFALKFDTARTNKPHRVDLWPGNFMAKTWPPSSSLWFFILLPSSESSLLTLYWLILHQD